MAKTRNLTLWNQVKVTDPAYTKQKAKPYPHTDINATYFFQRASEAFGPLGIGWGWELVELDWRENGLVVVKLALWYVWEGEKSTPQVVVGSKLAEYDTSGSPARHIIDDEAPKKAYSDAIKKWLSMLGMSSDIFMGEWDDAKDTNTGRETARHTTTTPRATGAPRGSAGSGSGDSGGGDGGGPLCPTCGGAMKLKKRRSDGHEFWSCASYPDCKGTVDGDKWPPPGSADGPAGGLGLKDDDIPF